MLITSEWMIDFIILLAAITFFLYKYFTRHYDYFKKRNIFHHKPTPFFGNMLPVVTLKTTVGVWLRDLYNSTDEPYLGVYLFDEPGIVLKCPKLIKQILVKDFNVFFDRAILSPNHDKVVSNMLFIQKNPDWGKIRSKITPAFSSGRIKGMFPLIDEIAVNLNQHIRKNVGTFETREMTSKYATDVIAKCAFAVDAHSFEIEKAEFRLIGKRLFEFSFGNAVAQSAYFFKPRWASFLRLNFLDQGAISRLRNIFWEVIKQREKSNDKGNDLIDILIGIRKKKELCEKLEFVGDRVVAQALTFFAAGYETTSATISFTLYELCLHPGIQDKVRKEILENMRENNGLTYECLQKMKYLDMCILESLRKYPALPFLDRICSQDYQLPDTNLVIEKGMLIYIPLLGLHYDEKIFPEPEKFIPERFENKNLYNVDGFRYMPFGEGPRNCIGERFGMLNVKVGLARIISEFIIERVPETPVPIKFASKSFVLRSVVGLPLGFREL